MKNMEINQTSHIVKIYDEMISLLKLNNQLFDENILHEFEMTNRNLKQELLNQIEQDRLLKIGIVGEVKAGKSSFLNALLFEGKEVLPKAATPMTAALTKIKYGEILGGTIVFYDQKDWQLIKEKSEKYDREVSRLRCEFEGTQMRVRQGRTISFNEEAFKRYLEQNLSPDLKGCHELVEMVEVANIDPYDYLGHMQELTEHYKIESFIGELNNYVGINGKFTPLVKHTELTLNLPVLKGVEVIDTPGTNDPIVSRGMTTRDFLGECDVIFLLSYAGQFLTNEDVSFIVSTLPNKGIKNAVLVGSKFDSAILDNNKIKDNFVQAFQDTQKKLTVHAKQTLSKHISTSQDSALKQIYDSMPPMFVSSLFYNIAQKEFKNLTEDESHILRTFLKRYSTFKNTKEALISYSRIDAVKRNKLQPIIEQKKAIVAERIADFENVKLKDFYKKVMLVRQSVESRSQVIATQDLKEYEKQYKEILKRLNRIELSVKLLFAKTKLDLIYKLKDLQNYLWQLKNQYRTIEVSQGERRETQSKTKFLLFEEEDVKIIHYKYITTTQLVKNLEDYRAHIQNVIDNEFKGLVDLSKFERKLKECIVDACDFSQLNFDEDSILISVEVALLELMMPTLDLPTKKYKKIITDAYTDVKIEDDGIHRAVALQNQVLSEICEDVCLHIRDVSEEINGNFDKVSSDFIKNVSTSLENELNKLKIQFEEKESYLRKYNAFKENLLDLEKKIKDMINCK
ncbi:dynamin family protein [Turicibacter sanguinis]|uniref:dynamin family protein n=1 Tax=Turicibacter sanguinis TaxID=154288 RepID=UPI00232D4D67|nr:dynamin family protein [Turicibacter sanguinis]MDB8575896.1 dynamin family protein [Turicibacter sanguinis]MDB8584483.1 dynamin family protein [Turicibacter sanguinis]MDB8587470.1 dynamin family protein [Turicibacter sanguinis]MDB8598349.1 dynamin family protein [Turicibacter sanguinis]